MEEAASEESGSDYDQATPDSDDDDGDDDHYKSQLDRAQRKQR